MKKTWWLTGFNPNSKFLDVKASDLKVTFTVKFKSEKMYEDFKRKWGRVWKFIDENKKAKYTF